MKLVITVEDDPVLVREKNISFTIDGSKPISLGSTVELMYKCCGGIGEPYRTRLKCEVYMIEICSEGNTVISMEGTVTEVIKHESYEPELQPDRVLVKEGQSILFYEDEVLSVL